MRTIALAAALVLTGCNDQVSSDEEAELAYWGLDVAIERAMGLGLDGYNAADSANIPAQSASGDVSGTMTVTGQVDQGASDNKELRLNVALTDYADVTDVYEANEDESDDDQDEVEITYDTPTDTGAGDFPYLQMSLRDLPDGTFTGSLSGRFLMSGDLEGEVVLDLSMDGELQEGSTSGSVERVDGTTTITGTATSGTGGTYDVDVTR